MEHRAFPILFEFYQEISGRYKHSSAAAEMICRDLGVQLAEGKGFINLRGCLLDKTVQGSREKTFCIFVARQADPEHRGFVVYHELAHWRLQTRDKFFARPCRTPFGISRTRIEVNEEYWCDGFAIAMLFAWAGREVLSRENCDPLFSAGTEDSVGSLEYRKNNLNSHSGMRIHSLNQRYFSPPYEGFAELANDMFNTKA